MPAPVEPKEMEGFVAVLLEGFNLSAPVIMSPDFSKLPEALPIKLAVIVVAAKFPEASRLTI